VHKSPNKLVCTMNAVVVSTWWEGNVEKKRRRPPSWVADGAEISTCISALMGISTPKQ